MISGFARQSTSTSPSWPAQATYQENKVASVSQDRLERAAGSELDLNRGSFIHEAKFQEDIQEDTMINKEISSARLSSKSEQGVPGGARALARRTVESPLFDGFFSLLILASTTL